MYPYKHTRRVYCAGPLFNERERREMVQIADVLAAAGYEPFVPHRDGMEFVKVRPYLVDQLGCDPLWVGQLLHEAIFALDVYQVLVGCGSLVCNLNGRVPDEGAVAEAAMAWTLGKPIVLYKEDARTKIAGRDNPLVVGMTDFHTVEQVDDIPEALRVRQAELLLDPDREFPAPPHQQESVRRGELLWQQLEALGDERPAELVSKFILDLFTSPSAR